MTVRAKSANDEWARLPVRPGERYQGLSRTTWLEVIDAGLVKSAVIRKPGSKRQIRLLHVPSALQFLESCVVTQPKANPE